MRSVERHEFHAQYTARSICGAERERAVLQSRGCEGAVSYATLPLGRGSAGLRSPGNAVQTDAVSNARLVRSAGDLKSHVTAIRRDDGIRSFPSLVVVELRQPHEVLTGAIQFKLPNVDVPHPSVAAERLDLTSASTSVYLPSCQMPSTSLYQPAAFD